MADNKEDIIQAHLNEFRELFFVALDEYEHRGETESEKAEFPRLLLDSLPPLTATTIEGKTEELSIKLRTKSSYSEEIYREGPVLITREVLSYTLPRPFHRIVISVSCVKCDMSMSANLRSRQAVSLMHNHLASHSKATKSSSKQ